MNASLLSQNLSNFAFAIVKVPSHNHDFVASARGPNIHLYCLATSPPRLSPNSSVETVPTPHITEKACHPAPRPMPVVSRPAKTSTVSRLNNECVVEARVGTPWKQGRTSRRTWKPGVAHPASHAAARSRGGEESEGERGEGRERRAGEQYGGKGWEESWRW